MPPAAKNVNANYLLIGKFMIKCDSKIKISTTDTNADAWRRGCKGEREGKGRLHLDLLKLALKYYKYLVKIL